jgi:hypothetical protein
VRARREHRYCIAKNNLEYELSKLNKEAVGRAQRLSDYRPLPDKLFVIFSGTFEIFRFFNVSVSIVNDFSQNPKLSLAAN